MTFCPVSIREERETVIKESPTKIGERFRELFKEVESIVKCTLFTEEDKCKIFVCFTNKEDEETLQNIVKEYDTKMKLEESWVVGGMQFYGAILEDVYKIISKVYDIEKVTNVTVDQDLEKEIFILTITHKEIVS